MLLSGSKLGEAIGISRQAVASAKKSGKLVLTGKKFDTENETNQAFIHSDLKKTAAWKRYLKKQESGTDQKEKPSKKTSAKKPAQKPAAEESADPATTQDNISIIGTDGSPANMTVDGIMRTKAIADMVHSQQKAVKSTIENQKEMNQLVPREALGFCVERFINHVYTGITRVCSQTLMDIGKDILANGEVRNENFKTFEDAGKQLVDDAKQKLKEDIENSNL